jgi:hypothetical protein
VSYICTTPEWHPPAIIFELVVEKSTSVIQKEESEEEGEEASEGLFKTPNKGRREEENGCHKERVPSARRVAKCPSFWHFILVIATGFSYISTWRGMPDPFKLKKDKQPEEATTTYSLAIHPHRACPLIERSMEDCMAHSVLLVWYSQFLLLISVLNTLSVPVL